MTYASEQKVVLSKDHPIWQAVRQEQSLRLHPILHTRSIIADAVTAVLEGRGTVSVKDSKGKLVSCKVPRF